MVPSAFLPSYITHWLNHPNRWVWNHCRNTNTPRPSKADPVTCIRFRKCKVHWAMEINLPLPLPQLFLATQRGKLPLRGNSAIHLTGFPGQNVLSTFPPLGGKFYCLSALWCPSPLTYTVKSLQTLSRPFLSWRGTFRASSKGLLGRPPSRPWKALGVRHWMKGATSWMKHSSNFKWVWRFQRVFEESVPLTPNIFPLGYF